MRWLLPLLVICACERGAKQPGADVVPCVAKVVVAEAAAGERPIGALSDAMTLLPDVAPHSRAVGLVKAIEAEAERAAIKPRALVMSTAARWLAPLGDLAGADKLARAAVELGAPVEDYDIVGADAALVIAWAGDLKSAIALAKGRTHMLILAAQGAAYAGNKAAALEVLAPLRDKLADDTEKAIAVQTYGLLHEVDTARALIAMLSDRQARAYGEAILAHALVEGKHPAARDHIATSVRNITEAVQQAKTCCIGEVTTLLTMLTDASTVLYESGDVAGAKQARETVRAAIPTGPDGDVLKSQLAGIAQFAGDTAMADALIKELGTAIYPVQRVHIANERGDFKTSIEMLSSIKEERGLAVVSTWGFLAKKPHDRALDDKFRAAVCPN